MLQRFCFLIAIVLLISGCDNSQSSSKQQSAGPDSAGNETAAPLGESYRNAEFDVFLQRPDGWILLEEPDLGQAMGTFAINLFKRGTGAEKETPLHVHAKAQHSYIAIWPYGYGTELPAGRYARLDTLENVPDFQFNVDFKESKALLFDDGSVWAYSIKPANPPANWTSSGFIFAQVASKNNHPACYDAETGKEKPLNKCDYMGGGDRYVRKGDLLKKDAQTIHRILESISLEPLQEKAKASDLIKIEKPLPNMDVTSPLTIKGKARGSWYFEGSFLVELYDAYDNKLAEKQVKADGVWMTEDFVPFEVTLTFNAPDDQRGQLIFHKANPSGLPENAMKWSHPVIFPPK